MTGEIVYGAIAGAIWLAWMVVIVVAYVKSRGKHVVSETGVKAVDRSNSNEYIKQERDSYAKVRLSEVHSHTEATLSTGVVSAF